MRSAATISLVAYALLSGGVYAANGALNPAAFPCAALAVAGAVWALWRAEPKPEGDERALRWAAGGVLLLFVCLGLPRPPGEHLSPPGLPAWHVAIQIAMAVVALSGLWHPSPRRFVRVHRMRAALLVALFAVEGVLVIRASPAPPIDVHAFQQRGADALRRGTDPYRETYPNIYSREDSLRFYGSETPRLAYPYPPLSLLLTAPARWAFGDVRYATLFGLVACGALLVAILGRAGRPADDPLVLLLVGALVLQPRALFVLEMAWTEPIVAALAYAVVWLVVRAAGPAIRGIVLGLLIASKQYALLFLPAEFWQPRPRLEAVAIAALLAFSLTLPFVVWDPRAFVDHVLVFQLRQPFRTDALSLPAAVFALSGWKAPGWVAFLGAALGFVLAWRRAPRNPAGFALGVTVVLALFFFCAKQAFANYYHLVGASMLLACATNVPPRRP